MKQWDGPFEKDMLRSCQSSTAHQGIYATTTAFWIAELWSLAQTSSWDHESRIGTETCSGVKIAGDRARTWARRKAVLGGLGVLFCASSHSRKHTLWLAIYFVKSFHL